ncbi:MAG TPA: SDR family oxidoreductase [Verrucomicrobiae bacterium]|jgi:3-oxoacyl-[acyl-carrier protein] reductase|nr:SDR family oxidoreductase [Verrucomicrobiae bacterium]
MTDVTIFTQGENTVQGQVVIVTGGAKGIGRHAVHTLAKAGATVVIADADAERMHKTLAEVRSLTNDSIAVPVDVRDEKDVRHLVYTVADRFGRIDALINDAGIVPHFNWGVPRWPRVRYLSKDFWDGVIQTNLGGTFLCTKYVVPFMEERRSGHIVNLWGGGRAENHGAAAYVVSKDAIRTFTRFVAEEEREWNVCVVAFSPKQAIATEDAPEEARKRLPGPESLANGFVLAAQAGMELTGKTVEHRDGALVAVD